MEWEKPELCVVIALRAHLGRAPKCWEASGAGCSEGAAVKRGSGGFVCASRVPVPEDGSCSPRDAPRSPSGMSASGAGLIARALGGACGLPGKQRERRIY